ncbi:MAG: DUF3052 domain-containing protein [Owenweeksia sp.]
MSKPVYQKLGYKDGYRYHLLNAPWDYTGLIPFPADMQLIACEEGCDLIHIFSNKLEECIELLERSHRQIVQNGMIWVSWYKKSSDKPSELNEDLIREIALEKGLVDVKVCAIDHEWSALKLVIPLKKRK